MTSIKKYLLKQVVDKNPLRFYVYAYIRSKDSATAKAGTPYYIGKGQGNRAWGKHNFNIPNAQYIVILEHNLTELGALAIERKLIAWWGRKDLKDGILYNLTSGGEGVSGISEQMRMKLSLSNTGKIATKETRLKMSKSAKGKQKSDQHKENARLAHIAACKLKPKIFSREAIDKRNASNTGKKRTPEQCLRIAESITGKTRTDEQKLNMSLSHSGENSKFFVGYYVTPTFTTAIRKELTDLYIQKSWCMNPSKPINKIAYVKSIYLNRNYTWEFLQDKTYADIGFGFIWSSME
jgi:hypothetical protein